MQSVIVLHSHPSIHFRRSREWWRAFRTLVPLVIVPVFLGMLGAGQASKASGQTWEQRYPGEIRQIWIANSSGGVEVRSWAETGVRVAAFPAGAPPDDAWSEAVTVSRLEPDGLQIRVRPGLPAEGAVRLALDVPAACQVVVRTGAGAVEVHGVTGSLVVETDSGAITCRLPAGLDADVAVRSLSGAVDVRLPLEVFGPDDPQVLDGRIGRGGAPLIVRSRSGSIRLLEEGPSVPGSSPQAKTVSNPPAPKGGVDPGAPDPEAPSGGGFRLRVESRLVNLNVRVTDAAGAAVSGLTREDFTVFEDDAEQPIAHFQPQTAPLNLFLLLDLSGSTKEKTDVIKQAAVRFIESLDPADRVAVAAFTSRFMRVSGFTSDRLVLRERIKRIRNTGGGTAFYDAVWYSLDELEEVEGGRQMLVIMSDGVDNVLQSPDDYTTKHDFESLAARAAGGQATLFPIYLDTEYEQVVEKRNISSNAYITSRRQLAQLADGTGGTLFRADRVEDLAGVYGKVLAELRTLYSLSYYAPPASGSVRQWRAVRVKLVKPDAIASTRPGYYSQ